MMVYCCLDITQFPNFHRKKRKRVRNTCTSCSNGMNFPLQVLYLKWKMSNHLIWKCNSVIWLYDRKRRKKKQRYIYAQQFKSSIIFYIYLHKRCYFLPIYGVWTTDYNIRENFHLNIRICSIDIDTIFSLSYVCVWVPRHGLASVMQK